MPAILFILSILLFIYAELSVLIWLGTHIGVIGVLLLLVLAFLAGIFMIRMRGWYSLTSVQRQLSRGEIPTRALIYSGIWIFAGVLLMIPGFISDILALTLLTPWGGRCVENTIKHKISVFSSRFFRKTDRTFHRSPESDIFEAEYEKQVDEDKRIK